MLRRRLTRVALGVGVALLAGSVLAGQQDSKKTAQDPCPPAKAGEKRQPCEADGTSGPRKTPTDTKRSGVATPVRPGDAGRVTEGQRVTPDAKSGPVSAKISGTADAGRSDARDVGSPRDVSGQGSGGPVRPTAEGTPDGLTNKPNARTRTNGTTTGTSETNQNQSRGAQGFVNDRAGGRGDPSSITGRGPSAADDGDEPKPPPDPVPEPYPSTGTEKPVKTRAESPGSGGGTRSGDERGTTTTKGVVVPTGGGKSGTRSNTRPDQGDAGSRAKAEDLRCRTTGNCPDDDRRGGDVDPAPDGKVKSGSLTKGPVPKGGTRAPVDPSPDGTDPDVGTGSLPTSDRVDDFEAQGGGGKPPESRQRQPR